jgi:transglutaminase-like putative cysteine protease
VTARERLTLAAALAVVLTGASLAPLFDGLGWGPRTLGAVAAVAAAGLVARRCGLPLPLQPLALLTAFAAYVVAVFAGPTLAFGVLPGSETLPVVRQLVGEGLVDAEQMAAPVPGHTGLVLLAVLGVGATAVLVDTLAVVLGRAALAGLPLLLLFAVPSAVLPGGLGWAPFALGAAGWLGLLLVEGGARVSRWGAPLRPAAPPPGLAYDDAGLGRVGRRIGAAALGVAVVVPAMIPGLDTRLVGVNGFGAGFGGASSTTTYNPITELAGQLSQPHPGRLLLTYRTDDPTPDYLRLTTLDVFDDMAGWRSSDLRGDVRRDAVQQGIPAPAGLGSADVQPLLTKITIEPALDTPWLPVPFPPTEIDVRGRWIWDDRADTAFSTRTSTRQLSEPYVVRATRVVPSAELLRSGGAPPEEISETYAGPVEVSDYVRATTAAVVAGRETDYDRVAALQAWFRDPANGFEYSESTDVPGIDAPNALDRFLQGRRGFCEQYASAMAAMVRSLGIPARVAVGYTAGTRQVDRSYRVTTSDAHAWPEVWFDGAGWVRFEPTPRSTQVTTPAYTEPPAESTPGDDDVPVPSAAPQVPGQEQPGQSGRDLDQQLDGAQGAAGGDDETGADGGLSARWGLTGVALLGLLALPALGRALRRRRRWALGGPRAAWRLVEEDAVDVGHEWHPAESPRAAAASLLATRPLPDEAAGALRRLALAAERERYAPPGRADADAGSRPADVAAVRAGLLSTAGRRQRWAARLLPLSTLRWAAHGSGTVTADVLDRLDAAGAAMARRLRRRARPV